MGGGRQHHPSNYPSGAECATQDPKMVAGKGGGTPNAPTGVLGFVFSTKIAHSLHFLALPAQPLLGGEGGLVAKPEPSGGLVVFVWLLWAMKIFWPILLPQLKSKSKQRNENEKNLGFLLVSPKDGYEAGGGAQMDGREQQPEAKKSTPDPGASHRKSKIHIGFGARCCRRWANNKRPRTGSDRQAVKDRAVKWGRAATCCATNNAQGTLAKWEHKQLKRLCARDENSTIQNSEKNKTRLGTLKSGPTIKKWVIFGGSAVSFRNFRDYFQGKYSKKNQVVVAEEGWS